MREGRMLRGGRDAARASAALGQLSRRTLLSGGLAALVSGPWLARVAGGAAADEADTSQQARDDAIRSLPIAELTAASRRPRVATRLDLFVQIDNTAADVVARTLSPWVGKVADANFHESCLFASKLSQTAEQRGPDVQRLADKLTNVELPIREEFARLAVAVQQRAAMREVGTGVQRR